MLWHQGKVHLVPEGRARRVGVLVLLTAVGLAAAIALVQLAPGASERSAPEQSAGEQMVAVSPGGVVELDELRPELQELYLAVADDPDAFSEVRCYCGCEAMLEHRHLLDCFVRPDGRWERHAIGCGICQVEAREVLAGRAAGTPLDEIIADIDATYGQITQESDA